MHQWVASYPSIVFSLEGSPNAVTSSQSVVDIMPTHCTQKKENIQVVRIVLIHFFLLFQISFGSKIAFYVTRWFTIMVTSNLHRFKWFGRRSWTHTYVHSDG
jgi:hypothetical protein